MIKYMGHRVTPNEAAKLIIEESGSLAEDDWENSMALNFDTMAAHERKNVGLAVARQLERVRKFLGFWELRDRVFSREHLG